jgi:PAS domain S-box-containing protein
MRSDGKDRRRQRRRAGGASTSPAESPAPAAARIPGVLDLVARALHEESGSEPALRFAVNALEEHLGFLFSSVYLYFPEADEFSLAAAGAGTGARVGQHGIYVGRRLAGSNPTLRTALAAGRLLCQPPSQAAALVPGLPAPGPAPVFLAPLVVQGSPVGVLVAAGSPAPPARAAEFVEAVAAHLGIALSNARRFAAADAERQRYRETVARIPEYLWSVELHGGKRTEVLYSPVLETLTGFTEAEHRSDPDLWERQIHPADRDDVLAVMERVLRGASCATEYRILRKDGAVRWVHSNIRATLSEDGEVIRLDGVVTDITDRKTAESALERRAGWLLAVSRIAAAVNDRLDLGAVLETTVEEVWRVVPAERIAIVRFVHEPLGATVAASRGASAGFRGTGERFELGPHLQALWERREVRYVPWFAQLGPGGPRVGSAFYVPVLDEGRCLAALIVYRRDVDAFEAPEREFLATVSTHVGLAVRNAALLAELRRAQQLAVELERARAIAELSSGLAHSFNNLFAGILGNSQLALRMPGAAPDVQQRLATIEQAALDGARMVERIRQLGGSAAVELPEPLDLATIAADALELLRTRWDCGRAAEVGALTVYRELAPAPSCGRPAELRECVVNLILNALLAMPEGGALTLRTGRSNQQSWLEVSDTGCGVPADLRERVWDPYFTTRGPRSTGLGLPVCRGILQRHGAEIIFESEEGRGTRVGFRLPAAPAPAAAPPSPSIREPRRGRVLLADDDAMVRDVHTVALQQAGYQVDAFADGLSALAALAENHYDVTLLDQRMPGMTGTELAGRIEAGWPELPVILLSGYREDVCDQVRSANVRRVLGKPVGLQQLAEAVATVLSEGRGPWPAPGEAAGGGGA